MTATEALAGLLEGLRRREAAMLGPLADALLERLPLDGTDPRVARGEPEGLFGIGRRGPLGRLLPAEWALLDVAPDEFLRRLSAAELGFYELDERAPHSVGALRVFVDAGPTILGGARLLAAAALLAAGAQATAWGARLLWRRAQPGQGWREGLAPGWLDTLLADRCLDAVDPAAILAETRGFPEGDRVLALLGQGPSRLGRVAVVRLREADGRLTAEGVSGRLTWPIPRHAGDLLRRTEPGALPTPDGAPRQWTFQFAPGFFFTASGARLLGRTVQGDAVALPVDLSGRLRRRAHHLRVRGTLRAIGWIDQRLAALEEGSDGRCTVLGTAASLAGDARDGELVRHDGALLVLPRPGMPRPLDRPIRPRPEGGEPVARGEGLVWLGRSGEETAVWCGTERRQVPNGAGDLFVWSFTAGGRPRLHVAAWPDRGAATFPMSPEALGLPIGLLRTTAGLPAPVYLEHDRLWIDEGGRARRIVDGPLVAAAVSPRGDCLAWLTPAGELELRHGTSGQLLGRSAPE